MFLYKKNINQYDFREYTYNYKTLKLLKKHIEENSQRVASHNTKQKDEQVTAVPTGDNAQDYYGMLEKGNDAFKKEQFEEALGIYEKARLLKPGDDIAQIKIEQTKTKLGEISKKEQEETESVEE